MIVAERFRADESGFAETGASHTKRLLVARFGLFKEMGRTERCANHATLGVSVAAPALTLS
jgi:hypothetical protein